MGTSPDPGRTASFNFELPRLLPDAKKASIERPTFEARCVTARQMAAVEDAITQALSLRGAKSLAALIKALGMLIVAGRTCSLAGEPIERGRSLDDDKRWEPLADAYELDQLWQLYRKALEASRPTEAELGKSESPSGAASASSAADAAAGDA